MFEPSTSISIQTPKISRKKKKRKTLRCTSRGGCLWCGEGGESIFSYTNHQCDCGKYRPSGKKGSICRCGHGEIWHDRNNPVEEKIKQEAKTLPTTGMPVYVGSLKQRIHELETELDTQQQVQHTLISDKTELQSEIDELQEKLDHRNDDDITVCIICLKENRSVLYLPCRHAQYCSECSNRWLEQSNKCPVCRGTVEAALDIIL